MIFSHHRPPITHNQPHMREIRFQLSINKNLKKKKKKKQTLVCIWRDKRQILTWRLTLRLRSWSRGWCFQSHRPHGSAGWRSIVSLRLPAPPPAGNAVFYFWERAQVNFGCRRWRRLPWTRRAKARVGFGKSYAGWIMMKCAQVLISVLSLHTQ